MMFNCAKFREDVRCGCPVRKKWLRSGRFWRKSDSKWVQRWRCGDCGKTVSQATGTPSFSHNKRRLNEPIRKLLNVGVAQRDVARIFGVSRTTVARKQLFHAPLAKERQKRSLSRHRSKPVRKVQFDEMETFIHTKLKPVSIALAVDAETREILGFQLAEMPARGPLAKKSVEKYGKRKDERAKAMSALFQNIDGYVAKDVEITSDMNPKYRGWLQKHSKTWKHLQVKGKRGSIVGGGELKKIGFDPLFSLNHTCAMIRAKMSRMMRRTWNTTKSLKALSDHLTIYMDAHNRKILGSG